MATWEDWSETYEAAYQVIPGNLHIACPNCGRDALRLVFTGHASTAVGYASFWCDNCLQGIVISRVPIPEGAVVRSIEQTPQDRRPQIPNFTIVE
jgi:hypothetical protein